MYYRTRAIILKNRDFKEADKLVTIFSESQGKVRAIAKGIKKPKSSLRACVQPFCHSSLFLSRGKELDLITQGKIIDFYGNTRNDINAILHFVYMMELLDKTLIDRVPVSGLYTTTLKVLTYINENGFNPLIIRYFEMSLLITLGYKPVLDQCVFCGKKTGLAGFNLAEGGIVCNECSPGAQSNFPLSGESLALARLLTAANLRTLSRVTASAPALKQLEIFMEKFLEYHLERRFNLKNIMRILKKNIII